MRYPVGESEAGKANLRHLGPGLCLSLSLSHAHTHLHENIQICTSSYAISLSCSSPHRSLPPPLSLPRSSFSSPIRIRYRSGHSLSSQTCKYEAWRDRLHLFNCSSTGLCRRGGLPDLEGQWENPSERRQLDILQAPHRHGLGERHQRNPHGMCVTSTRHTRQ